VKHSQTGYVPGIDGLRAVAVLSVVLYHVAPQWCPGGFTGVDVFFVISGFVVSRSLAANWSGSLRSFVVGFYSRRIVRLYPALVACLLGSAVMSTLFIPRSWLSNAATKTGVAAFFGLSNFALLWFDDGYFSPRVEFNPFTHTWSLAVEEQFYLVFPILFFYVWKRGGWRWLVPALGIVSLSLASWETAHAGQRAFYLLPSRFWELCAGVTLHFLTAENPTRGQALRRPMLVVGTALMGLGFAYANPSRVPFPAAVLPVAGAFLAVWGTIVPGRGLSQVYASRPLVTVGKMSYSIYLWHWPVLVLLRWTIGVESFVSMSIAIVATALLGALSYYYVENPVRRSRWIAGLGEGRIVLRGGVAIAIAALVGTMIFKAQPWLSLSRTRVMTDWHPLPWDPSPSATPPPFAGKRLFVVGDSRVGAYSTLLGELSVRDGVEVVEYFQPGCAVADLMETARPACTEFSRRIADEISARARPGDAVFLASLRSPRLCDQWKAFDVTSVRASSESRVVSQRSAVLSEAGTLLDRFERAQLHVILDAPKPVFPAPAFRCSDWFNRNNPVCRGGLSLPRAEFETFRGPVMETIAELGRRHPRLTVWDTVPTLCPHGVCAAVVENRPFFFDGDHLSAHGNRVLYPEFRALLASFWAPRFPNGYEKK